MKIELKNKEEIAKMRLGGEIASRILKYLESQIKEGMTTLELDQMAEKMILHAGAKPSFKGYQNYPGSICISVNEEVVHGIPGARVLKSGDIVGLDIGVYYQGFHTDTAITCPVGETSKEAKKLLEVTKKALFAGIRKCQVNNFLGDVQAAIEEVLKSGDLGIVKDLVGHGVGRNLQEAPAIPNFGKAGSGIKLQEGMTLAIEPMATLGDWHVRVLDDGWTIVTVDGSLSAHFEHTVAITKDGPQILTK